MRLLSAAALSFLLQLAPASAVTIDWVAVDDGRPTGCDPQPIGTPLPVCFGQVDYPYRIGKYEVTNGQYAEFLNAKASSDPFGLYDPSMRTGAGGIDRIGSEGSFTYSATPGRENMPVYVPTIDSAMRFANWMNNGQGNGDTETGAYTLADASSGVAAPRNPGARIFLPSNDEWYKAAYWDPNPLGSPWYDYPLGTSTPPVCALPGSTPNTANCGGVVGDLTPVGSYTNSPGPYGTFDQSGNASEWNETVFLFHGNLSQGGRGGSAFRHDRYLISGSAGFRLAAVIPEPDTGLLLGLGLAGLAARGTRRSGPGARSDAAGGG